MTTSIRVSQWRTVHKQLLWAYRGTVDPEFRQCKVTAYHYSLWQLLAGEGVVHTARSTVQASAGGWLLLPPCDHEQIFSDDAELLSIRFILNGPAGDPKM